jgi:DivIVA domain-containing protein
MARDEASNTHEEEVEHPRREAEAESPPAIQAHVPAEIRNASFPVAVRGYDRRAVETYVQRVNRVIAELEVTRSPQAAVRNAVERVSEQTKGILQEARESAENITQAAREEGGQILAGAKAEAADLVVNASSDAEARRAEAEAILAEARAEADGIVAAANAEAAERRKQADAEIAALQEEAEARMRDLQTDTDAVWKERQELLGEIGGIADRLQEAASHAAARFSREQTGKEDAAEDAEAALEAQPTLVTAPDESSNRRRG